jgi:hypothetical protein
MRPESLVDPPHVHPDRTPVPPLADLRFRALIGDSDWALLPQPIRRRFTKRLAGGDTVVYVGEIKEARMSRLGHWLAQALRLIGGPLPTATDTGVPSAVAVTEDVTSGGQIWTRLYARRRGFPQIVHSSKRFAGPTGLEEYVGYGVGMALTLHVENAAIDHDDFGSNRSKIMNVIDSDSLEHDVVRKPLRTFRHHALVFRSAGYFLQLFGRRVALPAWMTPGALAVTHTELGNGKFGFTLGLDHPWFGALIYQSAIFRETET